MLLKKLTIFTPDQLKKMPGLVYKSRFIIAITFALILLLSSCVKDVVTNQAGDFVQVYFSENILNKNFIVKLATDNGTDYTNEYAGYTFILQKGAGYYDGAMTGTKNGVTYSGTWSSNDDYSKLVINLTSPSIPAEFIFLNRSWKFTKKALPVMELAPWGTTEPKVLHMERL